MTYRILDLFCGAGGAARGYADAGFRVIGVDTSKQPRYPYTFHQGDALKTLKELIRNGPKGIDAVHASPPCQRFSMMSKCRPGLAEEYPDLIGPTRFLLRRLGLPYVIENVVGAPLKDPVMLCGTMFGLGAYLPSGYYGLQRHRLFETSFLVPGPGPCRHEHPSLPVYGHGAPGNRPELRAQPITEAQREAMRTPWMTRDGMAEAIPPAYASYIGRHLMAYLDNAKEAA